MWMFQAMLMSGSSEGEEGGQFPSADEGSKDKRWLEVKRKLMSGKIVKDHKQKSSRQIVI